MATLSKQELLVQSCSNHLRLNVLSPTISLRHSSRIVCSFSEHCTVWPCGELAEMSTPGKIGNCLECFPLVISFLSVEGWTTNCLEITLIPPRLLEHLR